MKKGTVIIAGAIIVILIAFVTLSRFFVDLLWFDSLGFRAIFVTVLLTEIGVFLVVAVTTTLLLAANGLIAAKKTPQGSLRPHRFRVVGRGSGGLPEVIEFSPDSLPWRLIALLVSLVLGVFIGLAQSGNWDAVLKWLHAAPFKRSDPLFGYDLGFYVFSLPIYETVLDWGLLVIFLAAVLAVIIYWIRGDITYRQGEIPTLSPSAMRHLSGLLGLFFLLKAVGYMLQRFDLLTSNNGVVFGAAYTDVHLRLPLLLLLAGASLLGAVLCFANIWLRAIRWPVAAAVIVFAVSLIQTVVPGLFQSYWVKP